MTGGTVVEIRSIASRGVAFGVIVAGILPATDTTVIVTEQAGATATFAPPEGSVPDLEARGWQLVLDDDFDGPVLDESIWKVHDGPGVHGPGTNRRDAVSVDDGTLNITTYSEVVPGLGQRHFTGGVQAGAHQNGTFSGFDSTYGYLEARIRLNTPPGTRSAFWALSPTWHRAPWGDPAASGPEIDIFEISSPDVGDEDDDGECDYQTVPVPCDRIAGGTMHWNGFDEDHAVAHQQFEWTGPSPQGNFLTYGLLWTPQGYWMYRDGVQVFHSAEAVTYSPEHLILEQHQSNTQFGGAPAEGYGSLAESTSTMEVDYVRVWQRPVSELPDENLPANTPVAIPFSVTDHFTSSPTADVAASSPGSVVVTATSDDHAVVPATGLTVTGNGPADPDGSLDDPAFELGGGAWTLTSEDPENDAAFVWSTRSHTAPTSLRLAAGGGAAEQTVTGLAPNTTYVLGGFFNLEIPWDDVNGNGRVDWTDANGDGECVAETEGEQPIGGDGAAAVDFGVRDIDAALADPQPVMLTHSRNAWTERCTYWGAHRDAWQERSLSFTTGPTTTSVTVFVDNRRVVGEQSDADLSFDSLYLRPVVRPNRTLVVQPTTDATGTATVTLTATNAAGTTLGTEQVDLTFGAGSTFGNGGFELMPLGTSWELHEGAPDKGASVMVEDPFALNRVLRLGDGATGTAVQHIEGLSAGTTYTVRADAKVSAADGDVGVGVLGGPLVVATDTSWDSVELTFEAETTTATIVVLDWEPTDGWSEVDDVEVIPTAGGVQVPARIERPLVGFGTATITAGAPWVTTLGTTGLTVTGVGSSNPFLVHDSDVSLVGGPGAVLAVTPIPGRTGRTTITVDYEDATGSHTAEIPVVVSDNELGNAAFDLGSPPWTLPATATIDQATGHSSKGALRLDGPATAGNEARQLLTGMERNTAYLLSGWSQGDVKVTVRNVPDPETANWPDGAATTQFTGEWSGSGWSEHSLAFTTTQCADCRARGSISGSRDVLTGGQVEVLFEDADPNDGIPVYVDDLALIQAPAASPLRELSLHQGQTEFAHDTLARFDVGGVPANSRLDPATVSIATSDPDVVPLNNVELQRPDSMREHEWSLRLRAGNGSLAPTGRAEVAVTLTDPAAGMSTEAPLEVTINAGDNFNNGDFQRGWTGWQNVWFATYELRDLRPWTHLVSDLDKVLRQSGGVVSHRITGLAPGNYVLVFAARGDGSIVRVRQARFFTTGSGVEFGSPVTVDSPSSWTTYELPFTVPAGVSEAWVSLEDQAAAPLATYYPCHVDTPGETCFDDLGIFRAGDVQ